MNKLITAFGMVTAFGVSSLLSYQVWAEGKIDQISFGDKSNDCQVTLNYDITVEPNKLVISKKQNEVYRIELGKLYVDGNKVELTDQQQQLINQYATEVSKQLPEVIDLVHDAVEMATIAVSMVLTPMFGDGVGAKIDTMMASLNNRVDKVAYQQGEYFYLGATESSLKETFGKEFEQEMEQLVQSSIGSFMMMLGSQMLSGDGESFEQKMQAFSSKMEQVGQDIEVQLEQQSQQLEQRADTLCENFQQLTVLEQQLREQIPQLEQYALFYSPLKLN